MKIAFQDIDGVMNRNATYKAMKHNPDRENPIYHLDEGLVRRVDASLRESGVDAVALTVAALPSRLGRLCCLGCPCLGDVGVLAHAFTLAGKSSSRTSTSDSRRERLPTNTYGSVLGPQS